MEKARINRDFHQSDILAMQSKVYFQGVGLPADTKVDITSKALDSLFFLDPDDLEGFAIELASLNAEASVYVEELLRNVKSAYDKVGKTVPACMNFRATHRNVIDKKYNESPTDKMVLPSVAKIIMDKMQYIIPLECAYQDFLAIYKNTAQDYRSSQIFILLSKATTLMHELERHLKNSAQFFPVEDSDVRDCYIELIRTGAYSNQIICDDWDSLYERLPHRGLPDLPLTDLFQKFYNANDKAFRKRYGGQYKTSDGAYQKTRYGDPLTSVSSDNGNYYLYPIHYMDNRNFYVEAIKKLKSFAQHNQSKYTSFIENDDVKGLAKLYLSKLDEYLAVQIEDARVVLDSTTGISHLVTSRVDTAAFLSIYAMVASNNRYGICAICGKCFSKSKHPKHHFCKNHSKSEKDAYTRAVKELEKKTADITEEQ